MTDARRAQALDFMARFMDGSLAPPETLRPSEGTLRERGTDPQMAWMEHHSQADMNALIPPETRQAIRDMPHKHTPLRINDDLEIMITNTVHSTYLINTVTRKPYHLPLNYLMRNLMFMASQSNTQRFAKIVQRYGPYHRLTHLIFTTGKIVETGPISFEVKRAIMNALVEIMRVQGLPNIAIGHRMCQNIVSAGMLRFPVRLWVLKARYGDRIDYDPTLFPGATIRDPALQTILKASEHDDDAAADPDSTAAGVSAALARMRDPAMPFQTVDSMAHERLDDPEAMRAANAYAHAFLERMSADGIETAPRPEEEAAAAAVDGIDAVHSDRFHTLVDEQLSTQKKKNIVGLIFANGCFIVGGPKNVRMQRRACAIMYDILVHCQDTPENRALEEAYLKQHGIHANAAPATGAAPGNKKKRGRPTAFKNLGKATTAKPRAKKPRLGDAPKK